MRNGEDLGASRAATGVRRRRFGRLQSGENKTASKFQTDRRFKVSHEAFAWNFTPQNPPFVGFYRPKAPKILFSFAGKLLIGPLLLTRLGPRG
jgi:hypothetical protein